MFAHRLRPFSSLLAAAAFASAAMASTSAAASSFCAPPNDVVCSMVLGTKDGAASAAEWKRLARLHAVVIATQIRTRGVENVWIDVADALKGAPNDSEFTETFKKELVEAMTATKLNLTTGPQTSSSRHGIASLSVTVTFKREENTVRVASAVTSQQNPGQLFSAFSTTHMTGSTRNFLPK